MNLLKGIYLISMLFKAHMDDKLDEKLDVTVDFLSEYDERTEDVKFLIDNIKSDLKKLDSIRINMLKSNVNDFQQFLKETGFNSEEKVFNKESIGYELKSDLDFIDELPLEKMCENEKLITGADDVGAFIVGFNQGFGRTTSFMGGAASVVSSFSNYKKIKQTEALIEGLASFESNVKIKSEEILVNIEELKSQIKRIKETVDLHLQTNKRVRLVLDDLLKLKDGFSLLNEEHKKSFIITSSVIKNLCELMRTPIFGEDFNRTYSSLQIFSDMDKMFTLKESKDV